jgi:simple sugar transport system substrate-binding protein
MKKIDPAVDEAIESLNMKDGPSRRRLLGGAGLFSATAAASALIAACSSTNTTSGSTGKAASDLVGNFPTTPKWQFWFVNHADTNSFFTPTQYGFADAAAILGLPKPNWGGDPNEDIANMVNYMNDAISAKAAGIALAVVSATGFTNVVSSAMSSGIPVISYNADGTFVDGKAVIGTNRLCYVGQALYISGQVMGEQIKSLVPGGGTIGIAIASPGAGNIQPRYDGAVSVLGSAYNVVEINTTTDTSVEQSKMSDWLLGNKDAKGIFAVDGGSTSYLAGAQKTAGTSLPSGGFDTAPASLSSIEAGTMDFTIFQDPYLQGFLPTMYMYLYLLSGRQLSPPDTDTGLTVLTKDNISLFLKNSRYQGGAATQEYIPVSGAISNAMATTST